jgi:hypothetical protein
MAIKKKKTATPVASGGIELVVRRGALRRFDKLKQATATLPVKVVWDRRGAQPADARSPAARPERRQDPPFTWDAADFVVVEAPAPPRRKRTRSAR